MDAFPSRSCRGCSLEGSESKMYSLSVAETRNLFYHCTSIWVSAEIEENTAHICFHCYKECEKWQSFKRMCEETEDRLQKPIIREQLRIDPVPQEEVRNELQIQIMPQIKVEQIKEEEQEEDTKRGIFNPERHFLWNPFASDPDAEEEEDQKGKIPRHDDNPETLLPNPLAIGAWDSPKEPEIEFTSVVKVEEEEWAEEVLSDKEVVPEEDPLNHSNTTENILETEPELVVSTAVEWLPHLDPLEDVDVESVPLSIRKKALNGVPVKKRKRRRKDGSEKPALTNGQEVLVKKRGRKKRKVDTEDPLAMKPTASVATTTLIKLANGKFRRKRRKKVEIEAAKLQIDPTWRNYSDPNNWDCPNCNLRFVDEKALRIHFREELTDHCKICSMHFKIPASIIPHIIRFHMKKWDCPVCKSRLDSGAGFTRHMMTSHRKGRQSKELQELRMKLKKKEIHEE